ncbi:MAG: hypothetical protein F4077_11185 [Gammaproteobacteria bacterium]|nr:hypothetical protein [Gammaproteobacteria bacterium]MYI78290.1 hypothetical protein [Gammaproteobacteria bacterium]
MNLPLTALLRDDRKLPANLFHVIHAATSANTHRAYAHAFRQFARWCENRDLSDRTLAEYVSYLHHDRNLAPSSISVAVAAIKRMVKAMGRDLGWSLTTEAVAGMRRLGKERGRGQSQGLTYEDFVLCMNAAEFTRTKLQRITGFTLDI